MGQCSDGAQASAPDVEVDLKHGRQPLHLELRRQFQHKFCI